LASSDHLLISKVITERKIDEAVKAGLKPDHFSSKWSEVWAWVLEYWREYGDVPTDRAIRMEFGDLSLVDASDEPIARLVDEVYDNYRRRYLTEALRDVVTPLNEGDTKSALDILNVGLQKVNFETARLRDYDLIESWEERLAEYEEMRQTPNSLRGIPTGFPGLDRITAGLRPQQLITFVGEAKKGKSLITMLMTIAGHLHGKTPMYISFEMSYKEQAARYDSLVSRVPYTNILRGELTNAEMERVRKALQLRKNMHPIHMVEDTASMTTVSAVAGKIQEKRPDFVIVDGVYLMDDEQGEPKGSPQALTNITRSLKRVSQRFDIPIIITTQVLGWKLQSKATRKITSDAIGYTSSFAQDSDLVLGVESDPDVPDQAIIRVVLARAAPHGEVRIRWDWNNMDFSEVVDDDDDDDDYDW
jgi:replicative DNA helicase